MTASSLCGAEGIVLLVSSLINGALRTRGLLSSLCIVAEVAKLVWNLVVYLHDHDSLHADAHHVESNEKRAKN